MDIHDQNTKGNAVRRGGAFRTRRWPAVVLAACIALQIHAAEPILIDGVAAYVNAHVITISEVLAAMDPVRRRLIAEFSGRELREQLSKAYGDSVNSAVNRKLIIDLYEKGEARLPEWLVDRRAETFIRETFGGDRTKLMKVLADEMITYDDWRQQMEEQLIVASMRGTSVDSQASVSPEEVRRYYDEHAEMFTSPLRIHLGMIMLVKDEAATAEENKSRATKVRERLISGEDFAAVARDASAGTKAKSGGDWGWISPDKLRPELAEALVSLAAGEVSELVETEGEFYILRVAEMRETTRTVFSEVQPEIERKLRRARAATIYQAWVGRLRRSAYIDIIDLELF
jgi:hypothetical protein